MAQQIAPQFPDDVQGQGLGIKIFIVPPGKKGQTGQEQDREQKVGQEHQDNPFFPVIIIKLAQPGKNEGRQQKGYNGLAHGGDSIGSGSGGQGSGGEKGWVQGAGLSGPLSLLENQDRT